MNTHDVFRRGGVEMEKKTRILGKQWRSQPVWKAEGLGETLITVDFVLKVMRSHCCPVERSGPEKGKRCTETSFF